MTKFLLDSDTSGSEDADIADEVESDFKVNEDFARKFTHNKKREELRRLEDKLGSSTRKRKRDDDEGAHPEPYEDTTSSESESEDDAGELVTEELDSEILVTLNAIRSKDPRVYDNTATFYRSTEDAPTARSSEEKPMFLRDYHRRNLLDSVKNEEETIAAQPVSYNQEQEALKRSIVGEITEAAGRASDVEDNDEDNFLITKSKTKTKLKAEIIDLDIENADKDPETFLSNFMASRAWVPSTESRFQPLESDDEDEERRADDFEEAYNFRFEDPAKSNEKLRSHARDMASKYSVRREEKNNRQKKRDTEKEKRDGEKRQHREDKARLRKLKIEEMREKVQKIKRAAGLRGKDLEPEDWSRFVDDDWDDAKWEDEMQRRFGAEYYAEEDFVSDNEANQGSTSKRKKKKPKWEEDININDIVPDFLQEDAADFSISEEDAHESSNVFANEAELKQDGTNGRKEAKKERRIIEQLVDDQLAMDPTFLNKSSKSKGFRYRETSPTSFGLSVRDIFLADDAQLNRFAGIKKLAAFRDPERKRKDRKHLGKRARLREWRKETFGHEDGLQDTLLVPKVKAELEEVDHGRDVSSSLHIRMSGKKKRRRSKEKHRGSDGGPLNYE